MHVHGTIGPYCGDKLPPVIKTIGNELVMRFHTDFFTEEKGFRAYWSTDPTLPAPTEAPVPPNPWDDIPIGTTDTLLCTLVHFLQRKEGQKLINYNNITVLTIITTTITITNITVAVNNVDCSLNCRLLFVFILIFKFLYRCHSNNLYGGH